jgi:hypothetical protein
MCVQKKGVSICRGRYFLSHPLEDSSAASLRVTPTTPDRTEALAGGDADGKVLRRGTETRRLGSRYSTSAEYAPVACRSRSSELLGRIWRTLALFFLTVQRRWQVLRHGRRQGLGISYNKASFLFLLRLPMLMLLRGVSWRCSLLSYHGDGPAGMALSAKPLLISGSFSEPVGVCCCCSPLLPAMVARKGGSRRCIHAGLEKIGEIFISSSSKLEALQPQLSTADMAATSQPPSRRLSSLLRRKLDVASRPSGLIPGCLVIAVGRRCTPEGSLRAARSRSSAA